MADTSRPGHPPDQRDVPELSVTVVYSPGPRQLSEWAGKLPHGATVLQALQSSAASQVIPAFVINAASLGVWGRKAEPGQLLCEGDRVEVYRPLRVDPKVARRERFRAQGARTTGLFANK
ncbi:MAG: RnfH family protein, partial [Ramlibacter sp.]|nr:RnfH family protein [Ramlibacter sp.]